MKKLNALILGAALVTAPVAVVADTMVSKIEVSADFSAVEGSNALEFYPDLETDLAQAIGVALSGKMADDGSRVQVIVTDMSVDGNAVLTGQGEFNLLSGGIFVYPPASGTTSSDSDNQNPITLDVAVKAVPSFPSVLPTEGPVLILPPSDGTAYQAMVDGFAKALAEKIAAL